MAQNAHEVARWLLTFGPEADVAIDDGGLALVEVDGDAYYEVGGIPEEKRRQGVTDE